MPNTTAESRYGVHDEVELHQFISREHLEISDLIDGGAHFTNDGISVTDDVLEAAMIARDIRREQRQRQLGEVLLHHAHQGQQQVQEQVREVSSRGSYYSPPSPPFGWGEIETDSIPDFEDDESIDFDNDEPRYEEESERVTASSFPKFDMPTWSDSRQLEEAVNEYFKQMEYRLRWIFYREEREGFRRRHSLVQPFSPQDFYARVDKASRPHPLNTVTSMFYDWNLGSTDFILRLESFLVSDVECLRCHFIHRPTNKQIGYQDRVWNGESYREVNAVWARVE